MAETATIHRLFDDGRRLALRGETRPDGSVEGIALSVSVCDNAECTCRDVDLSVRRMSWAACGEARTAEGPEMKASLDLDSGAVAVRPGVPRDDQEAGLLESLRRLLRPDVIDLMRERWHRVKGLHQEDEWRSVEWSRVDLTALVPFLHVFPSRWDLSLTSGRERYWVVDSWCLQPDCACEEAAVELVGDKGGSVGAARVELRRFTVMPQPGSGERFRCLIEGWLEEASVRRELRLRRKAIQRVARALPHFLAPPPPAEPARRTAGRNEPCPCGSGRKYKRCCGRG